MANPNPAPRSLGTVITLGGRTCVNASKGLYQQFIEQGLPIELWWGKANAFTLPLGRTPGTGKLLMIRDDLNRIDLNATHDLVFDDGLFRVTLKQVSVASEPLCLTPGVRGDPAALYLVDVADRRARLKLIPIDRGYNLLDCAGEYLEGSLYPGVSGVGSGCGSGAGTGSGCGGDADAWTWQTMVCDIASVLGIPPEQSRLPFTPHGCPHNFAFFGSYAWDALTAVLWRLACAARYDPTRDEFSIVRVGADDAAAETEILRLDRGRELDTDPMPVTLGTVHQKVRILFRHFPAPDDGTSPYAYEDIGPMAGLVTTAVVTGSRLILADDLPAGPGQTERAAERGSDYYRALLKGADRLNRTYPGIQVDAGRKLLPGSRIKAISWRDVGDGPTTELYRGPAVEPPAAELPPYEPPICCEGAGSGNTYTVTCADGTTTTVTVN